MAGAAGLVAVLAAVVVVLVHRADGNSAKPPPLGPHPADVQRIVVVPDGNPFGHTGGIQLSGGRSVAFSVVTSDFIKPVPGPHEAELALEPDDLHSDWHLVKAGDVITEYGVRVKVLKIWRMANPNYDAMDVQADPVASPPPTATPAPRKTATPAPTTS